ncbi:MAG: peptidoglycan DD-metalloendopeptidase family protein [Anaerolineae bacterium]|nr:peptidoglycan DD-metalloendopeptidase family protein [Anaerolineae bacterium]MDW8298767.1 peptidoglycan DD-metalloendopeptidase family protein [Anaerolineae bacterium]
MSENDKSAPLDPNDPLAFEEPLFDPDDTPPRGVRVPPPPTHPSLLRRPQPERVNKHLSALILGLALLITLLAAVLYFLPSQSASLPTPTRQSALPTVLPPTAVPTQSSLTDISATTASEPTAQPIRYEGEVPIDLVAELLMQPPQVLPPQGALYRAQNPFTVAPARGRSQIIQYRIQPGDTLEKIAARFGISQDTIIWNNDGIYVNRLLPGDTLTILPEDGILHRTRQEETIQSIADKYKVSPFSIVDSEFNPLLRNASPNTLLPPGITVMVVGGVSDKKPVYWNPGITIQGGGRNSTVSFGGGPGSCGAQPNTGGTGALVVPLPPIYTVMRGFSPYHTGIDLAAPIGTTVFAADGGTVIFAGWSNWGYGNTVVLAHGNLLTLYGHMSRVSVSCGQVVSRGTPIGAVGSTGNSSGPHLHFEIRVGEVPQNPESYLGF